MIEGTESKRPLLLSGSRTRPRSAALDTLCGGSYSGEAEESCEKQITHTHIQCIYIYIKYIRQCVKSTHTNIDSQQHQRKDRKDSPSASHRGHCHGVPANQKSQRLKLNLSNSTPITPVSGESSPPDWRSGVTWLHFEGWRVSIAVHSPPSHRRNEFRDEPGWWNTGAHL